ncbi:MAG TPA: methyl-accepting chemotaxis protein, partial [Gammaproteobacteria bacterium]
IGRKLLWGYGFVLALLVIVTLVAVFSLERVRATYDTLIDENARVIQQVNRLAQSVSNQVSHYRGALLYDDARADYRQALQASRGEFDAALEAILAIVRDTGETDVLGEIADLYVQFEAAEDRGLALIGEGRFQDARAFGEDEVAPLSDRMMTLVEQFNDRQAAIIAQERESLVRSANFLTFMMVAVSVAAIVAGLLIAVFLGRGITRRLQESAGLLSSSAAEILATTTQLASGATETDTAVAETTTTVEEVKQTAQVASEKARQVLESAQKAAQVSQSGRKSVEDSIDGMHHIQSQMEAIAESIVRLSEQSQAIGEIIAVVNNLAEQSNLLAVNAAIEATRAGEQGKGFAVVAQEVKSLAEQSKQATGQVRAILGDIQKATSSAVLATEQGSKAVEAGVKQSTEAGEVIQVLGDGVTEAANAATQIAASSQQQMVGMDQVALAMDNIKQASAQNVAGAKQAEVAAQSLHELGRKLLSMVGGTGRAG